MVGVDNATSSRRASQRSVEPRSRPGPTGWLSPAIYPIRVTHLHRSPVQHYAEHRSYSWYVDVDELPRLSRWVRPFARFEAVDHFDGAPGDTLRQRVDAFLARNDVFLPGGRVSALLMPRVLGRAFSPLSLFWCHDSGGVVRWVIAEMQNTRGERNAFLLPPSDDAPIAVAEALRNAPFAADDGYFLVRTPRPDDKLDVTVSLHRDNQAALVTTWRGSRRRVGVGQILALQLTTPMAPQMAWLSLRFQVLMLRWRGLPVAARSGLPRAQCPENRAHHSAGTGWRAKTHSWATS